MFIGNLNSDQQAAFLAMAEKIVAADGSVDDREARILEVLAAQCSSEVTAGDAMTSRIADDEFDAALFPDRASRVACLLELVGVALADEDYDATEKALIDDLAKEFEVSPQLLEDIESWVSRQMVLVHEAQQMMVEG